MSIAIVTDTACNFTPEQAESLGIYLLPIEITFGEEIYRDGYEITTKEFYEKMEESDTLPKTAQPSGYEAGKLYQELSEKYDKILSIHLGSNFSGTFESLRLIGEEMGEGKVTVFDTKLISVLAKFMVLEAKRLVDEGKTVDEVVAHLEAIQEKPSAYATLNSLDYLVQGGRIHSVVGSLVKLSKIKPIIEVDQEGVTVTEKVRTNKRALKKMETLVSESTESMDSSYKLTVVHGNVREKAEEVRKHLQKDYPNQTIELETITSVIGVHTGPEVIGIMMTPD